VHGHKIVARIASHKRPRGGHYDVTVRTKNRHGHIEYKVEKLALS
jgi:hypothetical protein